LYTLVALAALPLCLAQDPATGWMSYAVGTIPSNYARITRLEMSWTVSANPKTSTAFFSPWFGMDPSDNLNLIQPVNPWTQSSWSMYTEYYQWQPTHNSNSRSYSVKAGDKLHGSLVYNAGTDSYVLTQENLSASPVQSSSQTVACQSGKKYTIPYVVYEKTWPCADYPPDHQVIFNITAAECDGVSCVDSIKWAAKVKDANCQFTAHIDSQTSIRLTWSTTEASKYDLLTREELIDLNTSPGWERVAEVAKQAL